MEFDRLGVFTYSQEEGTSAHPLGDPVPQEVKLERQARIYDIQSEISLAKNLARIGSVERVLIEREEIQEEESYYYGRTFAHAPEVDGEVRVSSDRELVIGDFISARITGGDEYDLEAGIVESMSGHADAGRGG